MFLSDLFFKNDSFDQGMDIIIKHLIKNSAVIINIKNLINYRQLFTIKIKIKCSLNDFLLYIKW